MKVLKKVCILILVLTLISIPVLSLADDPGDPSYWQGMGGNGNSELTEKVGLIGGSILDVIKLVGSLVALAMLIWIGIKWITSTAQERADLKGKAVNYVIGAVFIFGASYLLPLLVRFIQDNLG